MGLQLWHGLRKTLRQHSLLRQPALRSDGTLPSSWGDSLVPRSLKSTSSGSELVSGAAMKMGPGCRLQELEQSGGTSLGLSLICRCLSTKPQAFIPFYRYIHAVIIPGFFLLPSPGDWRFRHGQDIFCQQLPAALCHLAPTLHHEGPAPLSLAVSFFSISCEFFPDKRNWSPLVLSFEACNNPFRNPFRLRHPSFTGCCCGRAAINRNPSALLSFALVATLHTVTLQKRFQLQKPQT